MAFEIVFFFLMGTLSALQIAIAISFYSAPICFGNNCPTRENLFSCHWFIKAPVLCFGKP